MTAFDPRVTPARADLAAAYLRGKVDAARFVDGEAREVVEPQAPLRHAPHPDASLDTEALKGERVTVYETRLTTVELPKYQVGFAAAELLLERINGDRSRGGGLKLTPELRVRESCGFGLCISRAHSREFVPVKEPG